MSILLLKKFHDLLVEFHDFSMTFRDHSHFPWLSRPGKFFFFKFHDFQDLWESYWWVTDHISRVTSTDRNCWLLGITWYEVIAHFSFHLASITYLLVPSSAAKRPHLMEERASGRSLVVDKFSLWCVAVKWFWSLCIHRLRAGQTIAPLQ